MSIVCCLRSRPYFFAVSIPRKIACDVFILRCMPDASPRQFGEALILHIVICPASSRIYDHLRTGISIFRHSMSHVSRLTVDLTYLHHVSYFLPYCVTVGGKTRGGQHVEGAKPPTFIAKRRDWERHAVDACKSFRYLQATPKRFPARQMRHGIETPVATRSPK